MTSLTASDPANGAPAPARRLRALPLAVRRLPVLLGWAAVLATLLSTEFLFQPFIWRSFGVEQIATAWMEVLRDRLIVGATLALALALARPAPAPGPLRYGFYFLAVLAGAAAGETILFRVDPGGERGDVVSLFGRVLRWTLVGGVLAVLLSVWRSGAELAAAGERARRQAADARRLAATSELERLRRQIEPHFLFNTLATIRRLHETDPAKGRHVLDRLFQFMSATLGGSVDARSTLGREVELVCAYLDVCASRMDGRLRVEVRVEAGLEAVDFPPLILATVAENAVKHGLFPQNGGVVQITARRTGGEVEVVLADDGVGLSDEGGGGGIGLANISERLRLLYGQGAEFKLQPGPVRGVCAIMRLPERSPGASGRLP